MTIKVTGFGTGTHRGNTYNVIKKRRDTVIVKAEDGTKIVFMTSDVVRI